MKRFGKAGIVVPVIFLIAACCGCKRLAAYSYEFRYAEEEIATVQICALDSKETTSLETFIPLYTLSKEDAHQLLVDVAALECRQWAYPPVDQFYGGVVICVTYANGEGEIIGIENCAYFSEDKTLSIRGDYFDISDIVGVIAKYGDSNVLAKYTPYFEDGYFD